MKDMQGLFKAAGDISWAWRLREIDLHEGGMINGRPMTEFQRDAWRYALKHGKYAPINTESEEGNKSNV